MNRAKWLRVTLIVLGVYWTLFGGLLLFSPATAEAMFGIDLPDRVLAGFAGLSGLIIALLAFMVSSNPVKFSLLVWGFVALVVGEILLNGFNLLSGRQTAQQAVPPMAITAVLLILLLVFGTRQESKPT